MEPLPYIFALCKTLRDKIAGKTTRGFVNLSISIELPQKHAGHQLLCLSQKPIGASSDATYLIAMVWENNEWLKFSNLGGSSLAISRTIVSLQIREAIYV